MLTQASIDSVVAAALAEDAPWGDVTSESLIPAGSRVTADLAAREAGVLSGIDVFGAAMRLCDPEAIVQPLLRDGESFEAGKQLASVTGDARAVLRAERVALNLL